LQCERQLEVIDKRYWKRQSFATSQFLARFHESRQRFQVNAN